ncbi:MAG TPA: amidohydrolase family protein [Candidatus Sulfotelmatobacter sp.]|nr:amidohydrolase family protein [Candidatus Sulfotelmatobacter sp.]
MGSRISRRGFLRAAGGAATVIPLGSIHDPTREGVQLQENSATAGGAPDRIVDMHIHFDESNPNFIRDLLTLTQRINLTACLLTPYPHRLQVADAAKQYPKQIVPFGFVDLDASDVLSQVKDFYALGYRGLGELEFVKKPYVDPSYMPVYDLAEKYGWALLFHTGIVLRRSVDQPENVASYRMRAFHLEEIARRFPKLTVIGAHCGNPEYEWAAEVARWNPNVFFDLSGSTLTKMSARLDEFKKFFWWSGQGEWKTATPANDPSAFVKLVFGSDSGLDGIEGVVGQYRALFKSCDVPASTQQMIMGRTLATILRL